MFRFSTLVGALTLTLVAPVTLFAQSKAPVLDQWYPALFEVDGERLEELLADNAEIKLEDLGITQTKDEFLDSLEEWADSVEGATFKWKLDPQASMDDKQATALVCYTFPQNQLLIREAFTFAGSKVVTSLQTTEGESCDGF